MTLPVLLDSRKPGSSSWVYVRKSTTGIRVTGLQRDDKLILVFRPHQGDDHVLEFVECYGEHVQRMYDGTKAVKAIHEECSPHSPGVFVELI